MSKYSNKEKLEAAHGQIHRWVSRYKQFGLEGLVMKRGSYTGNFKLAVIKYMHDNHCSLNQTAANFGISSDVTVGKWERIYYEEGPEGLFKDRRGRPRKRNLN